MKRDRLIPKTMASQHPDNASIPKWCKNEVIAGEDEVYEAYHAYVFLGCREAMWDAEGKDIDPQVVRKLLTNYPEYFIENKLGEDIFLTLRIPNPLIEVAEKKIFLETLQSIPKHNDVAMTFYNEHPCKSIFEVILPFTVSHVDLIRVRETYRKVIVEPFNEQIDYQGLKLKELVGEVYPKEIEVIPLIEDMNSLISCDEIIMRYIELVSPSYLRVFLARSDPALNYGYVAATLLAKLALSKLWNIRNQTGIDIYPIIGAGCLPFRGHNSPINIEGFVEEYKGTWTVTIQSAYRYDYPENEVVEAVKKLNNMLPYGEPRDLTEVEETIVNVIQKFSRKYQETLESAIDAVNYVASFIPPRRSRKLHIGLYGYSRRLIGKSLPRAIPFTGAFYSLGIPPEFIGMRVLKGLGEEEYDVLREVHVRLRDDLEEAARRVVWEAFSLLVENRGNLLKHFSKEFYEEFIPSYMEDLETTSELFGIKIGGRSFSDRRYANIIENFLISILEEEYDRAKHELVEAARLRRSIG
ncbi:MAG: phosphoenolpyruvate carboxylase [Nitrososphaerota archaeon]